MNWSDIQAILNSLPGTYRRNGPNYAAWQNSIVVPLERMTTAVDATILNASFLTAQNKWLDSWGQQFGVLRGNLGDAAYRINITFTLEAWRATPPGIQKYMQDGQGIPCTVAENLPSVGWTLVIQPGYSLTPAQVAALPRQLAFIRPAGVPYAVTASRGTGFLSTGNFLGASRFLGSWLGDAGSGVALPPLGSTNNTVPTLPTTWLTDPTINPSLSGQ